MNAKIKILCIAVTLFLYSCNDNSQLKIVELKPSMSIEELGDSTFFKGVDYITCDSRNIFASDVYNGRILKFDLQMNYIESIGSRGNGPEEFTCMGGGIAVLNDTLYAIDCAGLKTFGTDGKFIRTVKNQNYWIKPNVCCMDESECIYFSIIDTFSLIKYDKYMNRQFSFGNRRNDSRAAYLLCMFHSEILSVKEDEPLISLFNQQGDMLSTKNFYNDIFKSQVLFKKQEQEKSVDSNKKVYILFQSMTCFENKLYLLYIDRESQRPHCNRIVELTFENNDFHLTGVYQLRDNWYSAICRINNRFVCYSATNEEFQIYEP
jgi:hypothetical protein